MGLVSQVEATCPKRDLQHRLVNSHVPLHQLFVNQKVCTGQDSCSLPHSAIMVPNSGLGTKCLSLVNLLWK